VIKVPALDDSAEIDARLDAASRILHRAIAGKSDLLDSVFVAVMYVDQARRIRSGT